MVQLRAHQIKAVEKEMTYKGCIDLRPGKMPMRAKRAYWIWSQQRKREGTYYSARDFIGWYLAEWERLNPQGRYDVARKNHEKPYSFDNIELQPVLDNVRERNERCGNPGKTAREIRVFIRRPSGVHDIFVCRTVRHAAKESGVSIKTVYNYLHGRIKTPGKYGPKVPEVWFEYA